MSQYERSNASVQKLHIKGQSESCVVFCEPGGSDLLGSSAAPSCPEKPPVQVRPTYLELDVDTARKNVSASAEVLDYLEAIFASPPGGVLFRGHVNHRHNVSDLQKHSREKFKGSVQTQYLPRKTTQLLSVSVLSVNQCFYNQTLRFPNH